jgi:hypothetical protein
MTLRPEFTLAHSEFNAFLFAPVGVDKAGLPLTVLSALTRLGFDPWGEAARLSTLPVDAATDALAKAIIRLPEGDWKSSDSASIAGRLVACLPRRSPLAGLSPSGRPGATAVKAARQSGNQSRGAFWLLCLAAAVGGYMLLSHLTATPPFEPPTNATTQG